MNNFGTTAKCSLVVALLLGVSSVASAFFPPITVTPPPIIVLPPPTQPAIPGDPVVPPVIPPVQPPPFEPSEPELPTVDPCVCLPEQPAVVPEPATIISGLLGLGTLGVVSRFRRR